ncbi:hypothetical protein BHE74_00025870 [Ensete ventricosum]|nr:hypothetical protein BHE74_00025870 [Ensete ventricosum]
MLLPGILTVILLAELAAASDFNFTFNGFSGANLTLNGIAAITSEGLLKLTNDTQQVIGHAFYPFHVRFGKPPSFSTTFVFAIKPTFPGTSGHGIAFALSPSTELRGSLPSQHLGLFTDTGSARDHIVAVELDTVDNVEFKDINNNHVGIDVNSLISSSSTPVAYFDAKEGVVKELQLISGEPMQVWADYSGEDMRFDVAVAPLGESKPKDPLLSSRSNLSSVISDKMYVGFSSSTGAATGSHYILGWSFSLDGDAPPLDLSALPRLPGSSKKNSGVLAISLPVAAVLLLVVATVIVVLFLRGRKKFAELVEDWEHEFGPHRFHYKDLYRATKGFDNENLLGAGGFGQVYRGVLSKSKIEIAVKKISHESRQGMREFISEIVSVGRLRHRNLVQLLGYCRRRGELLLVYDYMANGSLDRFLFDGNQPPLNWSQRFHIIKGVAAGLLYLHEEWEQVVIHRDIKAGNVLLDSELNGKLGDFGLARLYDHGTNSQTTHIVGTLGYLAPEFSRTGKATTYTDVYAFGAFLLEVACGKRPLQRDATGLVDFVLECWKMRTILEASDPKLRDEYAAKEMELVLQLGLLCSHPDPMARPSMKQVVHILEGDASLPTVSADGMISCLSAQQYDESFDHLVMSYPSTSAATQVLHSSPLLSATL